MTVRVHATLCGHLATDLGRLLPGSDGRVRLPIPAYIVEHRDGVLVFDTGLHAELVTDDSRLGPNAAMFTPEIEPEHTLGARLAGAGIDPADVRYLANSHLHFDHVGGNVELANARLLIQAAEWKAGRHPKLIEHGVYDPADFDLGHDVTELDGDHDVFGDGSVTLLATPGHTAGHQSLQVLTESGPVVATADACYFRRSLDEMVTPQFGFDLDRQLGSMRRIAALEAAGARLVFGHDPEQWTDFGSAPTVELTA